MDLKLNILFIFSGWKYWWACRRPLDGSREVQPSKAEEYGWVVTLQDDEDWLGHLDCRICSHSQWPLSCSSCNWNDCWPLWSYHQTAWVGRLCEKISGSSGQNSWKTCQKISLTFKFFVWHFKHFYFQLLSKCYSFSNLVYLNQHLKIIFSCNLKKNWTLISLYLVYY